MIHELQLRVPPAVAASESALISHLATAHGLPCHESDTTIRILRRSIDARQRAVMVNLTLRAYIGEPPEPLRHTDITYPDVSARPTALIVGAGPGGLFAALRLIELGLRPVIVERGQDVHQRRKDVARISREGIVDPESNYSFGEGGAGAFSDGKLYTRSKKRGNVRRILDIFCQHGASESILSDAHPHIGTDRLPRVIEAMRETIRHAGGEVHFSTRMTALITDKERVRGIRTETTDSAGAVREREWLGPVILATGHSARDVYRHLQASGVEIEAKGIAVGVRLEHPAELIDRLQYHSREGRGQWLPAAEYNYVTQVRGRGVYSFCMCPGGTVVPAASGSEQVVVNGMSASLRNSPWSNSGMVVELRPEDLADPTLATETTSPGRAVPPTLAVMALQERLERLAYIQGGRRQTAPAQRMTDFVSGRLSATLPRTSYAAGLVTSPLHFWLPPFVSQRLKDGFLTFSRASRGFLSSQATMIAIETRTSAPVRIVRHPDTLSHIRLDGLFPCGEGAGYAGGIVSAAIDGERCAEMLAQYVQAQPQ